MPSQTGATRFKDNSVPVEIHREGSNLRDRTNDVVARRAYALYLADGAADGRDMEHWLRAESEMLTRVPEIQESSSWYTVIVPLPGFALEQIHVGLDANRATIIADKVQSADGQDGAGQESTEASYFVVADWPTVVDPSTASAYLKDASLSLTVKRADSIKS